MLNFSTKVSQNTDEGKSMSKRYDEWNEVKKETDSLVAPIFKEREVYYMRLGDNVGHEQNGKGDKFVRPVIILKRLSRDMFIGIPLSSQIKSGSFYHTVTFFKNGVETINNAIVAQIRLFSARRLLNKIGMIHKDEFNELKKSVANLLNVTPPKESTGLPEGN